MNNVKIKEDIDSLTYAMSDEEIFQLQELLLEKFLIKKGYSDISEVSDEEFAEIIDFNNNILPLSRKVINSLANLDEYTLEELEAENRKLYEKKEWEKYL